MATDQTVQSAVWQIELGRGKLVIQWAVVVLAAIALAIWYAAAEFRGLEKREAMDLAQLARNIARGEGYTTSLIRPISLWQLTEKAGWNLTDRDVRERLIYQHPDLYNPPLYPWLLAGLFRLAGDQIFQAKLQDQIYAPERWIIVPFGQLCFLLTVLLVYFWARQAFDNRVAITAGLLLLASDTFWSYSITGLAMTFWILLLTSAGYLLFLADRRLSAPTDADPNATRAPDTICLALVAGSAVLMGLAFLTRYTTVFFAIAYAVYAARILRGRGGWAWAGIYLAILLAIGAPWLIRNYQLCGSFLGLAKYQFIESEAALRDYHFQLSNHWSVRSLLSRFLTRLQTYGVDHFRAMGSDICIFFFVVALLYSFRRREVARLRRVVVACLALGLIGMCIVGTPGDHFSFSLGPGNLYLPMLPLVIVFGVAFFYLLLDRIPFRMRLTQAGAIGLFALVNVAPLILVLLPPTKGPYPYPPYCAPYTRLLSHWFDKDEVGVSDAPWSVAWNADRRCIWLPASPEQYAEIHDFVAPRSTQFLFLTPYMLDRRSQSEIVKGEFKPWSGIIRGQIPERFPLRVPTLLPPDTDQILFAEKPRWQQRPIGFLMEEREKSANTNAPPEKTTR